MRKNAYIEKGIRLTLAIVAATAGVRALITHPDQAGQIRDGIVSTADATFSLLKDGFSDTIDFLKSEAPKIIPAANAESQTQKDNNTTQPTPEKKQAEADSGKSVILTFDTDPGTNAKSLGAIYGVITGANNVVDKWNSEHPQQQIPHVKANFCLVGSVLQENKSDPEFVDLIKKMASNSDVAFCNHSWTHRFAGTNPYSYCTDSLFEQMPTNDLAQEIVVTTQILDQLVGPGHMTENFRPPGCCLSQDAQNTIKSDPRVANYKILDCNIPSGDAMVKAYPDKYSADYIVDNTVNAVENNLVTDNKIAGDQQKIVVMHTNIPQTVEALPKIIEKLINDGYSFNSLN